jgi:Rieske Fe-S protein
MQFEAPSRREFIKTIAMVAAYSTFLDKTLSQVALADVSALATTDGIVSLPISASSFPALRNTNGSLRIKLPGTTSAVPNVIITNLGNNEFAVVDARCTHQGTLVNPYTAATGRIRCPNHGSEFTATGEVLRGPSTGGSIDPLPRFAAEFDAANSVLKVTVPNMAYSISALEPVDVAGPRLKLTFPTLSGMRYEIRRRLSLTSPWIATNFSATADGPLTTTSLTGNNRVASVFVERLSEIGFFAIVRIN